MRYRKEIAIAALVIVLVLLFKRINALQSAASLEKPWVILPTIALISAGAACLQRDVDKNHAAGRANYQNIDILKYLCAILIIILHLRPFQGYSGRLDLVFNNIVTRIAVPVFFLAAGFFAAKQVRQDPHYLRGYLKKTTIFYLVWSLIYLPVGILVSVVRRGLDAYLPGMSPGRFLILFPLILAAALAYTGVYYHLWYFPAVILSLLTVAWWRRRWGLKGLLIISFVLLLFGATETYYGVLPANLQQWLSYYYSYFFTTRNFLFFGLFYTVLGYYLGEREDIYPRYCIVKLVICGFALIFEAALLQGTDRLNSNILLSCVPLTYYLFVASLYLTNKLTVRFRFRHYAKYYYLVHPLVILGLSSFAGYGSLDPFAKLLAVLAGTHLLSMVISGIKQRFPKLVI